ncbi:MAG: restriction endonuclease subunit S [Thermoanaerobaculia bacterium]
MAGETCPSGWRLVKLGELGEVNRGRSRHRPRYASHLYGGPYPFIQTGDIRASGGRVTRHSQTYSEAGLAQSRLWPAGTLCITIAANIAETAILTYPACFPDSVVGFLSNPSLCDVRFVEYMFRFLRQEIQFQATGSVQYNINLATLGRLTFPAPSLEEQILIAGLLGALDDKIELNRRMNQTLEAMARAIFKSWFVDFEPFNAVPLDSCTLVPSGWKTCPIGDAVTVLGGSTPSTTEARYWGGDYNFATPKDLSNLVDPILLDTERTITAEGLSKTNSGLLSPGTVLLSSRAPIGYLAITEIPVAVNQGFIAMVCDRELPSFYVLQWARHNMETIIGNANGTTFLEISKQNFRPIEVIVPPKAVLDRFVDLVAPLYRRIASNLKESRTLSTLRDTLLPKLLSGEIHVKQAEKLVAEVV